MLQPGYTVLDVGANIGEFSFFLSTVVTDGAIHAFEPQRKPFGTLRGVCSRTANAHPHNVGLSSSPGEATLFVPIVRGHPPPPEASLDPHFNDFTGYERRPKSTGSQAEPVRLTTLDDFCKTEGLDRLDFVKIDVEGHELEVAKGGEDVCLCEFRPILLMEVFPYAYNRHLEAVCGYLASRGYVGMVLSSQGAEANPLTRENAHESPGHNYLFLPREKVANAMSLIRAAVTS
jgi:FkbM family methyltransferase